VLDERRRTVRGDTVATTSLSLPYAAIQRGLTGGDMQLLDDLLQLRLEPPGGTGVVDGQCRQRVAQVRGVLAEDLAGDIFQQQGCRRLLAAALEGVEGEREHLVSGLRQRLPARAQHDVDGEFEVIAGSGRERHRCWRRDGTRDRSPFRLGPASCTLIPQPGEAGGDRDVAGGAFPADVTDDPGLAPVR
jgi:hypothetical protein